jgi:hypothetical protein
LLTPKLFAKLSDLYELDQGSEKNLSRIRDPQQNKTKNYRAFREREERRLRALQRKNLSPQGNQPPAVRSAPAGRAPAQCRNTNPQPASPLSLAPNLQSNDDLTYQSTLLHMRVVGKKNGGS